MQYVQPDVHMGLLHPVLKSKKNRTPVTPRQAKRQTSLVSKIIADEIGFLSLRNEWSALVNQSPAYIYQTFDWQWFWWKHYGADNTLHIVTFRSDNRLVGIIPMFIQAYTLFGKPVYKRLRMIGCGVDSKSNRGLPSEYGPSDYLDAIVLPEYASETADTFASYIMLSGSVFDEVECSNVPEEGFLQKYFIPALEAKGLNWKSNKEDNCPYISLPATTRDFIDRLRPSTRYRVRQAKKEFNNNLPFIMESITNRASLDQAYNDLMYLHQIRWNRLGYAGLFSDTRFRAFQNDILHSMYEQGFLWFKAIKMGGVRTAARLGFHFKGRMYDYLSGFDETAPGAKKRPSLALLIAMTEEAIENDAGTVDFLRGTESYKFELTNDSRYNAEIRVTLSGSGASLRRLLYRMFRFFGHIGRRVMNEWTLLVIQRKMHGGASFLFSYLKFIVDRVKPKLLFHSPR